MTLCQPRRILFTEQQIQRRVFEIAGEISRDLQNKDIVLVCVLKGGEAFHSDLGRELEYRKETDDVYVGDIYSEFISVGSYGDGQTSGELTLQMDVKRSLKGAHVIVVEDVVDTGKTLDYLHAHLLEKEPASLRFCLFIEKPDKRQYTTQIDYVGFSREQLPYIVGYGMDDRQRHRHVPYIFEVEV